MNYVNIWTLTTIKVCGRIVNTISKYELFSRKLMRMTSDDTCLESHFVKWRLLVLTTRFDVQPFQAHDGLCYGHVTGDCMKISTNKKLKNSKNNHICDISIRHWKNIIRGLGKRQHETKYKWRPNVWPMFQHQLQQVSTCTNSSVSCIMCWN